jgi:hypothetical protein
MKKAIDPIVELTIAGNTYRLAFDFEAISEAEDLTERPILTGLTRREVEKPSISFVRAMLYAAMRLHQPELALADVKALVNQRNIGEVWGKALEAFFVFRHAAEDEDESESGPTGGQS